jgi:hypothetical protein
MSSPFLGRHGCRPIGLRRAGRDGQPLTSDTSGPRWFLSWQQFSLGNHHSGELVDVHVTGQLHEVWAGNGRYRTSGSALALGVLVTDLAVGHDE